jgi:hypothetical protein
MNSSTLAVAAAENAVKEKRDEPLIKKHQIMLVHDIDVRSVLSSLVFII